jgi:hypothetical protein
MLVVWDARIRNVPEHLRGVVSAQPAREERFRWRWSDKLGDLVIGYAVIPPVPLAR